MSGTEADLRDSQLLLDEGNAWAQSKFGEPQTSTGKVKEYELPRGGRAARCCMDPYRNTERPGGPLGSLLGRRGEFLDVGESAALAYGH